MVFVLIGMNILVFISTSFISYAFIIVNIFHISSTEGRAKSFIQHLQFPLMTVSLFLGAAALLCFQPSNVESMNQESGFGL